VTNKKNADAFKKVLKDAYDGIISDNLGLNESGHALSGTAVMSKDEINKLLEFSEVEEYAEEEEGYNDYRKDNKKSKRKSSSSTRNKKKKPDDSNDNRKSKEDYRDKRRKDKSEEDYTKNHKKEELGVSSILLIPFKILVLPIIIFLSVIIIILDFVSLAVWIVSKVLLVASIAVASIYGYLVYTGSAEIRYDLFAACGVAFVLSVFLPLITKIFRAPLKSINNTLKDFVF
jgi:uncharacterized membrane protein